jgi:23S rRNA U2552 (ribose-2'-O)-methylase RlmE/FtsJ
MNYEICINYDIILNTENQKMSYNLYKNLKNRLNKSKSLLDEIPAPIYQIISKKLDVYNTMRNHIKKEYNMQIVTNACLKMYEMLHQHKIISEKKKTINVFCNAELPGGFIIAINHYVKTNTNLELNWLASSYVSSTVLGDVYGIYENNKDKWLMSDDMNGDVTDINNILKIKQRVLEKYPSGIDLYTSDIGIDVTSDYNTQEEQTLLINYCQILCGLLTLGIDGTMITKQFTFFTPFNTSLLILLHNLFKHVFITKPLTSRPINSEIYIVCKNFKGLTNEIESYLLKKIQTINLNIPLLILYKRPQELISIANDIYNMQISMLMQAYRLYKDKTYNTLYINYVTIQRNWINLVKIKQIKSKDHIPMNTL